MADKTKFIGDLKAGMELQGEPFLLHDMVRRQSKDGRPFLHYFARAWIIDENGQKVREAAQETGFLRCRPEGRMELVLAHGSGISEIWYGQAEDGKLELRTAGVSFTESAKEVTGGHRLYGNVEGDLLYAYDMAAVGQELQPHLWARLKRQ